MAARNARNNYNDPQAWALKHMRELVKGIIWLIVRECRTIGQLAQVVDNLVHHWWRRGR